jgi:hypothetical protein
MPELRESLEPISRVGKFGVDAPWLGAGVSTSELFSAESGGLVLPGNRGDPVELDAFSPITSGARRRCPFELAGPSAIDRMTFS